VFIFYRHGALSSSYDHGGSQAHRIKQRPEVYLCGVWGHPYPAVLSMGIESDVSPRNPSLLYSFISFFVLLPRTRSTVLDEL
jgi:hypothetical protein